ncbi:MAG: YihA family ribosome biogenesis GTP-binding protein [Sphingobacteriales bacterium]|nr:MAG: YihA family ribosome biogenesis GTP-binding protein [Sphingobacteriales bacterium]
MEIRNARYIVSSPNASLCPKPDRPEYAFIGRSNVGKSSLINMLTRNAKLAKTSAAPGKTQLINHFEIESEGAKGVRENWYLVDLPGYGYAKVSQTQRANWQKMISGYLRDRPNLLTVFVLLDSRLRPQQLDLDFLAQLGQWEVPFNMIFTKADKVTQREASMNAKAFINKMREEWEFIPRSFMTSSIKFLGRKDILGYIDELNAEFKLPEVG